MAHKVLVPSRVVLYMGDCLKYMDSFPINSVDAIVTDPPYEISFMDKFWDNSGIAFNVETWQRAWDVLRPGGHLVAFSATRTYHRMVCAIEDAGFEIRDCIFWCYGSGFPKSLDIAKNIDKAAGKLAHQSVGFSVAGKTGRLGTIQRQELMPDHPEYKPYTPATDEAREWQGYGTALKPAVEPICLARKPLSEKTVAANVLRWGTGAINIDGCRIGTEVRPYVERRNDKSLDGNVYGSGINGSRSLGTFNKGRWPANFCHDGSKEVVNLFPHNKAPSGIITGGGKNSNKVYGKNMGGGASLGYADEGSASRYFLEAPMDPGEVGSAKRMFYSSKANKHDRAGSSHPTVKPVSLMRWLVRLVTPPNGVVLDPFAGSGTTGAAAHLEGRRCRLIEMQPEYQRDIIRRMAELQAKPKQEAPSKHKISPEPPQVRKRNLF